MENKQQKLLIVTQTVDVNNPVLGFFHGWIEEFAKHYSNVTVICLEEGSYSLPDNVKVLSLGKNDNVSKLKYVINFYKYIWQQRHNYDAVFVHMNPEYIVLAGLFWKLLHKKISLWYTHKRVNLKLRVATFLSDIIFTASQKSFRIKSSKVHIMGHGIDVDKFKPTQISKEKIILQVGRLSSTKRQLELLNIFTAISHGIPEAKLYIVGGVVQDKDESYHQEIINYISDHNLSGRVKMLDTVANQDMPAIYQQAKVVVNLSTTGSLDKDVLEAMACNTSVVTTNEAFQNIVPKASYVSYDLVKSSIVKFLQSDDAVDYRGVIVRDHSLNKLISNIKQSL